MFPKVAKLIILSSMLHHTNVDRLWALWQSIRPQEANFSSPYPGKSRWQSPNGTEITYQSPLHPFYKDIGTFHSPESAVSIANFGYSYEGLEYWEKSSSEMQSSVSRIINELYGPRFPDASEYWSRDGAAGQEAITRHFVEIELDVTGLDRPCSFNVYNRKQLVATFPILEQPEWGKIYGKLGIDNLTSFDYSLENISVSDVLAAKEHEPALRVEIVKVVILPSSMIVAAILITKVGRRF